MNDNETVLGLLLNLDRERMRRAAEVAMGIDVAFAQTLDLGYCRAQTDSEDDAVEMQELHAARVQAAIGAMRGGL